MDAHKTGEESAPKHVMLPNVLPFERLLPIFGVQQEGATRHKPEEHSACGGNWAPGGRCGNEGKAWWSSWMPRRTASGTGID